MPGRELVTRKTLRRELVVNAAQPILSYLEEQRPDDVRMRLHAL